MKSTLTLLKILRKNTDLIGWDTWQRTGLCKVIRLLLYKDFFTNEEADRLDIYIHKHRPAGTCRDPFFFFPGNQKSRELFLDRLIRLESSKNRKIALAKQTKT